MESGGAEDATETESGDETTAAPAPDTASGSVLAAWQALAEVEAADFPGAWSDLRAHWDAEIPDRERFNGEHFEPQWDLRGPDYADMIGHGTGRTEAPSRPGEFAVERRGDLLLNGIYPGGAYTHLLSTKHPGVIQTPSFEIDSGYIRLPRDGRRPQLREYHHRELLGASGAASTTCATARSPTR